MHAVLTHLLHAHGSEITHNIGQDIGGGVSNFVKHLLGNHRYTYQATRVGRLGDDERAVRAAFENRVADIGPIGHAFPIGKQTAGGLCAALQNVPAQAALRHFVQLVRLPVKGMHERAQGNGAINHAPRNHHVCTGLERSGNRHGTEVGIGRENLFRHRRAAEHFARAFGAQRGNAREDIVAFNYANL